MNYKIKSALKKSKMALIIAAAIWIALSILLSAPIAVSVKESTINGIFDSSKFFEVLFSNFNTIGSNISKYFTIIFTNFWKVEGYVTIGVLIMLAVGIVKSMPKMNIQILNTVQVTGHLENNIVYLVLKRNFTCRKTLFTSR